MVIKHYGRVSETIFPGENSQEISTNSELGGHFGPKKNI